MTKCQFTGLITKENQQKLTRLTRAIALSQGEFALILVRCNYRYLREQLLANLCILTQDIDVREISLHPATTSLHNTIFTEIYPPDREIGEQNSLPSSVMIFGLESVIKIEDLLTGINQARDIYAANFQFPLVLWLQDEVASLLSRLAPDFKSWAATTIKFEMVKADLISLIRQETESLFTKVLEADAQRFLSNAALDLDPKSQQRYEIESARNDLLRLYGVTLEPELAASLEFVLGRDEYANDRLESAISHYQNSLVFWQQQVDYCLHQAVGLFHVGLCYRRLADLNHSNNSKYWREALCWFQQCLDVLATANRQDLVAKFILAACETLLRLEAWSDLEILAKKSLQLHEIYGNPAQVAQDYGFLTAVAVARENWLLAHELVNTALTTSEVATGVSRQQESWYLLLLAKTQQHLGAWQEAINNLEWARVVCELQYEPLLYLEILTQLQLLYFEKCHDYAQAFSLKQEIIQIEHQYGFRAFIGASQLQPRHHRINSILAAPEIPFMMEDVAQEIATSGRQQDVKRLVERIHRPDYKLTIIHGPSGVGKSSIIKAGLIPTLEKKVVGHRLPLPLILSVYNDWTLSLGRILNQTLTSKISLTEITPNLIIEKIRLLTESNQTIILIFDQFEEFFFNINSISQRIEFYNFFCQCLNIPFVKIILALREDYLHYLLEVERLSQKSHKNLGVINRNILDKDIRYFLGNFSCQDAISIITNLAKRSRYEIKEELIKQLVEDLAGETGEVHPIELQIVGAQLQAENISNLEQYKSSGGSEKLVERWLEEVIKDCGQENEELSWKILFELTDDKGRRPPKTRADLVVGLGNNYLEEILDFESAWELIIEILVGSGLVLRIREESGDRYQLVHDYLVEPIRQKNNYGIVAELEKVKIAKIKAEAAHKRSQEQLNLALKQRLQEARIVGVSLALMAGTIGGLCWQAESQKRAVERSRTNLEISVTAASSEDLFSAHKEFDSLLEGLRAWRQLKQAGNEVEPDTRFRVVTALEQAVYGVTELNRLEGHSDIVWSLAFSPNGKLLASGSRDHTVKIWQTDGTLLQTLKGHTDAVTSVSFSPDGQTLASTSIDKTVKLWQQDPTTGKFAPQPVRTFSGHGNWMSSVSFSPDGELLATGSNDSTIELWRKDGTLVKILRGHHGWVNWVTFSPDGQFLASASDDKTVKIWRRDGSLVETLSGHQQGVTAVAFSPDGQILASGGRDKMVKLWRQKCINTQVGCKFELQKSIQEHSDPIWSLNFSPDGKRLAATGDDHTINIWSLNGILLKTFKGHTDIVTSVVWSPNQKLLASAGYDKTIRLWSLDTPKLPVLRGHQDRVLSVAWSPDGHMLATGSRDRTIKLWQQYTKNGRVETRLYKTLRGHTHRVSSVSFDPKGQIIASGSYDKTIKLWQRDGTLIKTLQGHRDSVMSVSFSPNGQLLASASKDQTIKLWQRDGTLLKTLVGHQGWVNSVAWSPDGQVLASASDDQTVRLWRRDGTLLKTLSPHDSWVLGVSFSPTDQLLASASWDNTVKLWRWDGTLLKTLLKGYSDSVNAVTFSPDGQLLAVASWDSTAKIWSREGELIKTLNGHRGPVLSVSFSPDGQTLASASEDNTVILWNLRLDDLLLQSCSWVGDYLQHNRNVDQSDRLLCQGITTGVRSNLH